VNNVKQLGVGFLNYVSDNDSYFPLHKGDTGVGTNPTWVGRLFNNKYAPVGLQFICPSANNIYKDSRFAAKIIPYSVQSQPDYGYNHSYLGSNRYEPGCPAADINNYSAKLSKIRYPSKTITLTDVYSASAYAAAPPFYAGSYYVQPYFNATSGGMVDCRHAGAANVLWVDGHATSEKSSVVMAPGPYKATRHPYMADVFMNGTTIGDPKNNFDLR